MLYYGCSRARDKDCKAGYMREEELIEQLVKLVDKLDLNEMHMRQKFEEEAARLNKFLKSFFGGKGDTKAKEIDLKDYAKYLLLERTAIEKREFLGCLKSRLMLKDKAVKIQK